MAAKLLKRGDRIRLKVRTIDGWKGVGIVTEDQLTVNSTVVFHKEDNNCPPDSIWYGRCFACRHEVARINP